MNYENGSEEGGEPQIIPERFQFAELMQRLRRVAKLQEGAMNAQIDARQKRREAVLRRQEVWVCDADFMRCIQFLNGKGHFEGREELVELSMRCQNARDELGPTEQEGIEAEQNLEGQMWDLQQAQEQLIHDFQNEYKVASTFASLPTSTISSDYASPTQSVQHYYPDHNLEDETTGASTSDPVEFTNDAAEKEFLVPKITNAPGRSSLLGMSTSQTNPSYAEDLERDSDSGIGDLDRPLVSMVNDNVLQSFQPLSERHYQSLELYPQLLTEFHTKRDRITRWLENTALISRLESLSLFTILKCELDKENVIIPSNWAQLVIAYWNLDGATSSQQ